MSIKIMLKFKLFLIVVFSGSISTALHAQDHIEFTYDASGNRIMRQLVIGGLKSGSTDDSKDLQKKFEDVLEESKITIYPNPTEGKLKVQFENLPENEIGTIHIFDNNGRLIKTISPVSIMNNVDLTSQSPGIYYMKIIIGDSVIQWKVIKY